MSSIALRLLRRGYATTSTNVPALAQSSSSPLKVKERRDAVAKTFPETSGVMSTEERRRIVAPPVNKTSGRSRLRGVRVVRRSDGTKSEEIVGQRIYLPNTIFTLVRNQTPPGKPYNPYEATFRVPQSVTKTDIRAYLQSIYGVETTYIRTDNYIVPLDRQTWIAKRKKLAQKKPYKRAVVGLVKPFYYPLAVEDMDGKDRWLRESTLEDSFRMTLGKDIQRLLQYGSMKGTRRGMSGLSLDSLDQHHTRANIVKKVWERKEKRERITREIAQKLVALREEGEKEKGTS